MISSPIRTVIVILASIFVSLGFTLIGLSLLGDEWMQYNEFAASYFIIPTSVRLFVYLLFVFNSEHDEFSRFFRARNLDCFSSFLQ